MSQTSVQIRINGEARQLPPNTSLSQLVADLNLAAERIAVELNHVVLRRNKWTETILQEGDLVEIVHFVGGGRKAEDTKTEVRRPK